MKVIYFINFISPCVMYIHGMLSPRLVVVPFLIAVGSLLHIPAAESPALYNGVVISCQSFRVRERAGAEYFSELRMVVFIERRAFSDDM